MVRRFAATYARLVGLMVALLGAWLVSVNVIEHVLGENTYEPASFLYLVIGLGLTGLVGGVAFLLSWDGPERFRSRAVRVMGWLGMVFMSLLPWTFSFVLFPLVALAGLTLFVPSDVTSPN